MIDLKPIESGRVCGGAIGVGALGKIGHGRTAVRVRPLIPEELNGGSGGSGGAQSASSRSSAAGNSGSCDTLLLNVSISTSIHT